MLLFIKYNDYIALVRNSFHLLNVLLFAPNVSV